MEKPVRKQAQADASRAARTEPTPPTVTPPAAPPATPPPAATEIPASDAVVGEANERDIRVETRDVVAVFTNRGARLKSWRLRHYLDANSQPLELVPTDLAATQPLPFSLRVADDRTSASAADVFAVCEALEALIVMLTPFSPHVAEEMWEGLGHEAGLLKTVAVWPKADPRLAAKEELEIPVQVNGKLRSRVIVAPDISEADLRTIALADGKVQSFIDGHEVVKVIVVPQRLVNVVVK